jgi:hypothetical protein
MLILNKYIILTCLRDEGRHSRACLWRRCAKTTEIGVETLRLAAQQQLSAARCRREIRCRNMRCRSRGYPALCYDGCDHGDYFTDDSDRM